MHLSLRLAFARTDCTPHDTLCTYGAKQLKLLGFSQRHLFWCSLMCFRYTIDEHVTAADFCNLFFRLVFTRNLIGRFNQICHDLIELRGVF